MIGLAISCLPLNTSFRIQNLQLTSAACSHTPKKHFYNFKHVILWNTLSAPFFEARQAHHIVKHAKPAIL